MQTHPHTMRGADTFNDLFGGQTPAPVAEDEGSTGDQKGRNPELSVKRNKMLCDRYHWYGHHSELRYDAILERLSAEFCLSDRRISDIISNNTGYLAQLRKDPLTVRELRAAYPHLSW